MALSNVDSAWVGIEPVSLALVGRFLSTGAKSHKLLLNAGEGHYTSDHRALSLPCLPLF